MNLPTFDQSGAAARRPRVCRLLRTKTAYGSYLLESDDAEQQPDWQDGSSTTAVFWCLKTMAPCGPDDAFAHARSCRAGRACFRPDDDD